MYEFGSTEALNNRKMEFVEEGMKKEEIMQEFLHNFYLESQIIISLKAFSSIGVNSALLNTFKLNKNLSLALKSGICGAHNVSELIHHLFTFKDYFEVPKPSGQRAFQNNINKPSFTDNTNPSDNTSTQGTAGIAGTRAC
ncbi:hypothetical protein DSO57_1020332 [Entomophthora muscae]|uniref:Uncharacterized protein n=1 Tax=Entomophthora muscae TaxID=34485 RepID=A0ACC2SGM4_9FUNG|nr:hypothetical protein DSO57_1020332 [Entomophthora muscae]